MFEILKIVKKGDYLYAVVPDHPNRTRNNYVLLHRVVMENHLGRLLTEDEVVHHLNEDKKDNRIENLEVMTKEEHNRHHSQIGRQNSILQCAYCHKIFARFTNQVNNNNKTGHYCSRSCNGKANNTLDSKIGQPLPDELIQQIRELASEGASGYKIAKKLGISGNTAIKYMREIRGVTLS